MLHINGKIPLGLANSGRIAAVSFVAKKTKQKWKFFSTEKASRVHMAQGSPGQDGQPSLLRDAGQPPTWGRGWVRSTLLPINLAWERPGNFSEPNPNFKSKPVEEQHSSYLTKPVVK